MQRLGLNLAGKPQRRTKIPEILDMCRQFKVLKRQSTWNSPDSLMTKQRKPIFPECVTKGSHFTFWGSGWSRVRSRPLLCSQPFAHDRREAKMAVSMGEAAKTYPNLSLPRWSKKLSCRFEWQAWHFVTVDVFQKECICRAVVRPKWPCLWGKPQKRVFRNVSEDVLMSF